MKNILNKLGLWIGTITISCSLSAQLPQFSQFYATPIIFNPANTGNGNLDGLQTARFGVQFTNSTPYLPGNFRQFSVSYDQKINRLKGGFGLTLNSHSIGSGLINNKSIGISYAYHGVLSKINKINWNGGVNWNYSLRSVNFENLRFGDQITLNQGFFLLPDSAIIQNRSYQIWNAGLLISSEKYFAGLALSNINEPNYSLIQNNIFILPFTVNIHAGYTWKLNKTKRDVYVTPQGYYSIGGHENKVKFGFNSRINKLYLGAWFQMVNFPISSYNNLKERLNINCGTQFKNFKFMYDYGIQLSDGRSAIPSMHEISLIYQIKTKKATNFNSIALC